MANTKVKAEQLEAAQTNITSLGTLTALTVDDITIDGSTISDGGDLTIDVTGNLILDADGGEFKFRDGGTDFARIFQSSGNFYLNVPTQDTDLIIQGNDGGSNVSALTFDMSDAGAASFNSSVGVGTASPNIFSFTGATNHVGIQASGTNQWGLLTIAGTGTGSAGISLGAGSVRHALVASANNSSLVFYTNASNSGTSLTERIRIRAGGGVGIGTAGYDGQILAVNAGTGDLVLYGESTDANCFASFRDNSSTANISYGAIANNHVFRADQTERMRIDSSGRLLIGTTSHASGYSTPGGNSGENAHYSKLWIQGNTYATTGDGRITLSSGTSWPATNTAIGQIFFSTAWGGDHAAISCFTAGAVGNTDYPGELRFYTTPDGSSTLTHRMSVKQDGSVHVGPAAVTTDSNYAALIVKDNNINRSSDSTAYFDSGGTNDWTMRVGGSYNYALRVDTTSSATYAIGAVADSSTWKFRVNGAGDIYAVNTTVQSISDRRLKENITDAKSQWDDIKALKWKNFNWTKESGHDDGKPKLGLIADEVEKVSPNLIDIDAQPKEDIDAGKEDPEYKTVKYSIVWMKAMKALQEAMERIEVLESEVKTLKGG